jgi:hypothetical protein
MERRSLRKRSVTAEAIQGGSDEKRRAVRSELVGSKSVDCDEQEIGMRSRRNRSYQHLASENDGSETSQKQRGARDQRLEVGLRLSCRPSLHKLTARIHPPRLQGRWAKDSAPPRESCAGRARSCITASLRLAGIDDQEAISSMVRRHPRHTFRSSSSQSPMHGEIIPIS